jgi:hypothetical protein
MNNEFLKNKANILLGIFAICAVIVSLLWQLIGRNNIPQTQSTTLTPTDSDIMITGITPDTGSTLTSQQKQQFFVSFDKAIQTDWIAISLVENQLESDRKQKTPFSVSLDSQKRTLTITTNGPIGPGKEYDLTITNIKKNKILLDTHFLSGAVQPTPIPVNNEKLKAYLPYQTASFVLDYDSQKNIYNFRFIYNPSSSDDIQTQYDTAKNEATTFIESKGIDITSIVINWNSN